jgi:hypothetical protein
MLRSKKLKPGQPGTKRLLAQYGERLVCVRYRYDPRRQRRYKTVKLVVEEEAWSEPRPLISPHEVVGVQVALSEIALQRRIKQAGGKWNPARRLWEMRYEQAVLLKLESRIDKKHFR